MSLTSIQQEVFDESGALYPGQVADFGTAQNANSRSYLCETVVEPGYAVVKGYDLPQNSHNVRTPYGVKAVEVGSVDADFVGMVVRSESFMINDETNKLFRPAKSMNAIAERGSGMIMGAKTFTPIQHGDKVYMSVDATQPPTEPVGSFGNISGLGNVELTGLTWYGAAAANTIARIKL